MLQTELAGERSDGGLAVQLFLSLMGVRGSSSPCGRKTAGGSCALHTNGYKYLALELQLRALSHLWFYPIAATLKWVVCAVKLVHGSWY